MPRAPSSGLITLSYIIYGLHLFSALAGVLTSAMVVTAFLTGWPSIIAVIFVLVTQLISDIGYVYLNPRIRVS